MRVVCHRHAGATVGSPSFPVGASKGGKGGPAPHSISVPVQLIVPSRDPFMTTDVYRGLDRYVEDLRVHPLSAGHWAQRSHPEQIERWAREFIESVEGASGSPLETCGDGAR